MNKKIGLGLEGHLDILSNMSSDTFFTYSFQHRILKVILRYTAFSKFEKVRVSRGHTDIMSFMSPRYFSTYSFQWRIPPVILRYMAHLDSSNKLFFILKKSIEKTALVTQNHHF